jgi:hypothetical protein
MTSIVLDDGQNEHRLYTGGSIDQNSLTAFNSWLKTLRPPECLSEPYLYFE